MSGVRGALDVESNVTVLFLFVFSGDACCLTWILGHSYVYRGALRADVRKNGRQLGFNRADMQVRWIGLRGMVWSRVLSEFQFHARCDRAPDVLLLHVGGNDMALRPSRHLIRDIKMDLICLWSMYPDLIIVWSDIVARRVWREARSVDCINRARAKVNKEVGSFVKRQGGIVVRHRELEKPSEDFLSIDGIHLSDIGMDMWALELREGLEMALRVWRDGRQ